VGIEQGGIEADTPQLAVQTTYTVVDLVNIKEVLWVIVGFKQLHCGRSAATEVVMVQIQWCAIPGVDCQDDHSGIVHLQTIA